MTDDLESNSPNGSAGLPNSVVSEGKNVQQTSTPDASKLPDNLDSIVSKAVEKAMQSQKDKRFSSIEKEISEFKPVLERVKTLLTPEQMKEFNAIQKDAEFEELKQTVTRLSQTGVPETGNQKNTATEEAQHIFQKYEVDMNDPAAVGFLGLKGADLIDAVATYAFKKSKQPTLDSSAASSIQGSSSSGKITEAQAETLYAKLGTALLEPTKNKAEISKLKKELNDQGYKT